VYYPRDIAALQAAYEKQSVFATGKPAANAPGTTLRSDLSEPAGGEHDTVRAYGGQLDPLALEAVLQAIVEQLQTNHIQFVLVRSSNTLDQAFLSQFLRRSYPEGRVVLNAADLLFLRSRQDVSLRGVMAHHISSFGGAEALDTSSPETGKGSNSQFWPGHHGIDLSGQPQLIRSTG